MNDIKQAYKSASEYWSRIPATIDGVLGGFGYISNVDIEGSTQFLKFIFGIRNWSTAKRALDCGAGIGRITKNLLIPHFEIIDLVEPDSKFLNSVNEFVGEQYMSKIGCLYNSNLQDFNPDHKYDVIWNQWVLGHLGDEDLVLYLIRCRKALGEKGLIVIKENVTSSGKVEVDEVDSSVTRPLKSFLEIFKLAKLKRIKQCKQTNFPDGIYPVYMFALIPESSVEVSDNPDT